MELRQLSYFLTVLETGSLTAAAERLGLTQQALSRSLARLEEQLGGKLFDREARGMIVTRLGDTIAEHARPIVAEARRLRDAANAELGLERGRLVVGLSPVAATTAAGAKVMQFALKHPNVRIDVESGIDVDFVAALHRGEIDIAISGHLGGAVDSVLIEQLSVEQWGVAGCRTNKRLAKARHLSDLANHRWIIGRNTAELDARIVESFVEAGLPAPRPGVVTTSGMFILNILRFSDCLAILPRSKCELIDNLQWHDFSSGTWNTPIFLMRRKRALTDDLVRALLSEFGVTA